MLNWAVPETLLEPFVPRGCELDFFFGKTYVSVVGFLFQDTQVLGLRIPWHVNFSEVNLRFYVIRREEAIVKRGVTFISEIVPRFAIAQVARLMYNEPYVALPMRHVIQHDPDHSVSFEWKKEQWMGFSVKCHPTIRELTENSIERFIAEHYYGYTSQRDGTTIEYRLEHVPWTYQSIESCSIDPALAAFYPEPFLHTLQKPPDNMFMASGSPVLVFKPTLI